MSNAQEHAPGDRHDDVAEEQQIVDPPAAPDAEELAGPDPED